MADLEIKRWYETNKEAMVKAFVEAGQTFPTYAALPPAKMGELMEREWFGACSIFSADEGNLTQAVDQAREQLTQIDPIPMDEQTAFMLARVKIIQDMLDNDSTAAPFRPRWYQRLEQAQRYYQSVISAITAQARIEKLRTRQNSTLKTGE